jgi:hypothetical protein
VLRARELLLKKHGKLLDDLLLNSFTRDVNRELNRMLSGSALDT